MMHQGSLEPAAIRFTFTYRSLPGDQDIFSLLFSCIYIHRNTYYLEVLLVEPNGHCFYLLRLYSTSAEGL